MSKVEQEAYPVDELNYYHLTLNEVPLSMSVPEVAELIQVQADAPEIKTIRVDCGYDVVPHQLHVFKETLPTKFAMFTYYLKPTSAVSKAAVEVVDEAVRERRERAHDLFVQYMHRVAQIRGNHHSSSVDNSKTEGVKTVSVEVNAGEEEDGAGGDDAKVASSHYLTLAQPTYVRNCLPFLEQVSAANCPFFDANLARDPKKLRTFLLSKVRFFSQAELDDRTAKRGVDKQGGTTPLGVLRAEDISAREWAWLRAEHKAFPQQATSDLITAFFVRNLSPLFVYHETITV